MKSIEHLIAGIEIMGNSLADHETEMGDFFNCSYFLPSSALGYIATRQIDNIVNTADPTDVLFRWEDSISIFLRRFIDRRIKL